MYTMLVFATYRLTHLIVFDKITEFLRKPFLRVKTTHDSGGNTIVKKEPSSMFGYLLNCYWCAGIWSAVLIGLLFIIIPNFTFPVIFILSLAGAQAILETFVGVAAKWIKKIPNEGKSDK